MGVGNRRGRWLRSLILSAVMVVTVLAPVSADTDLVPGGVGVVAYTNGDGVNLRDGIGYSSTVLSVLPEGEQISILDGPVESDAGEFWYQVQSGGTTGWVVSTYLARGSTGGSGTLVVVGTDGHGLRLREAAGTDAGTLTVIPEGAEVVVVGADATDGAGAAWANVGYGGLTGFASTAYLAPGSGATVATVVDEAPAPEPAAEPSGIAVGGNVVVTGTGGGGLNIRYGAGYGNGVATMAPEGAILHVLDGPVADGDGASWWNVDYNGLAGWAHSGYLAPTDQEPGQQVAPAAASDPAPEAAPAASSVGEQIAATAMQYVGYPYVWGGTSPSGFDCSGFTYYVVNQVVGSGFPRSMEAQASSGVYVSPDDLQPGDLVFQQNTYQWGLSHAGIYIGNGQFVNAANESVGVVISNLWDSYWGPRFYTARRIAQ